MDDHAHLHFVQFHFHDAEIVGLGLRREYQNARLKAAHSLPSIQYANQDALSPRVSPKMVHPALQISTVQNPMDLFYWNRSRRARLHGDHPEICQKVFHNLENYAPNNRHPHYWQDKQVSSQPVFRSCGSSDQHSLSHVVHGSVVKHPMLQNLHSSLG